MSAGMFPVFKMQHEAIVRLTSRKTNQPNKPPPKILPSAWLIYNLQNKNNNYSDSDLSILKADYMHGGLSTSDSEDMPSSTGTVGGPSNSLFTAV